METKKLGRPLKTNTNLSHDIKVRLDAETFNALNSYCQQNNLQRAATIRTCIRNFLNLTID